MNGVNGGRRTPERERRGYRGTEEGGDGVTEGVDSQHCGRAIRKGLALLVKEDFQGFHGYQLSLTAGVYTIYQIMGEGRVCTEIEEEKTKFWCGPGQVLRGPSLRNS